MKNIEEFVKIFKALSDPQRIRILKLLEIQPFCVCEMASILGLAPSTISSHLSILKEAGLIFDHKEHRWVSCYLNRTTRNSQVQAMIAYLETQCNRDPVILSDREKAKQISRTTFSVG